jgi:hypothetical protein
MEMSREERKRLDTEGEMVGIYQALLAMEKLRQRIESDDVLQKEAFTARQALVAEFRTNGEEYFSGAVAEEVVKAWRDRCGLPPNTEVLKHLMRVEGGEQQGLDTAQLERKLASQVTNLDTALANFTSDPIANKGDLITVLELTAQLFALSIERKTRPPGWQPAAFMLPAAQRLKGSTEPLMQEELDALVRNVLLLKQALGL